MSKVKYILHFFSMYDHTGIKNHLEKMAAKGWMLEKTGTFAWKYRKCEPKKVHFAINYFPKASEFAPGPTEEQKTMFEYCEQVGWKLVSTAAQMQIFYNEKENPVPLETDAVYREYRGDEPQNNFLICWGNKIVEISFYTFEDGIQEEWIPIVAKKLKDF